MTALAPLLTGFALMLLALVLHFAASLFDGLIKWTLALILGWCLMFLGAGLVIGSAIYSLFHS